MNISRRPITDLTIGFDRTDATVLGALASTAEALAARADALAAGRQTPAVASPLAIGPRRRGASPAHLVRIRVAQGQVDDATSRLSALRTRPSWPPDGTSALIFVRDALQLVASRVEALDDPAACEHASRIAASLSEARRRLRHAHYDSAGIRDVGERVERVHHLHALRELVWGCTELARAVEQASYGRG